MLFDAFKIRDISFKNRLIVSPMCQYSSEDGFANDWHLVHLGSRAVGGTGLIITEATAVEPKGRISPQDLGIWKDEHIDMLKRITHFIQSQGSVAGIQLAHAGRKASVSRPWEGDKPLDEKSGGWTPIGPSPVPFAEGYPVPQELTVKDIKALIEKFVQAAQRSLQAGFQVLELHAAHGYLLHEFLSPVSNKRADEYGGTFENRIRIVIETVDALRKVWPERLPLFVRISATDWLDQESWDLDQSVQLAKTLKPRGIDLIDCSSGAIIPHVRIPAGPGFQVPFAERIRRETGILTGAVGSITSEEQAETILRTGQADMIIIAREFLRDPYFPLHTGSKRITWPVQYGRVSG